MVANQALPSKMPTPNDVLLLYAELSPAEVRATQRRLKIGSLKRIAPGVVTSLPEEAWPALIARERIRVLASLYPKAVMGPRSAFLGGVPSDGVIYLTYRYTKRVELPGVTVQLVTGHGPAQGDTTMMGKELYFPSTPRVMLENLAVSRGNVKKSVGKAQVEQRLIVISEARGEQALNVLRDEARAIAPMLGLEREFAILEGLIGAVLGTRKTEMSTPAGIGMVANMPYDANHRTPEGLARHHWCFSPST